ncbi:MAG: ACT domain-containing protein [Planctomycetota bacterium]|jgi:ACT domain-containing protein
MGKRFITVEDINRAGRGPLVVDADTVVTPQAQLAAEAAGITIQTGSGQAYAEPLPDRGPDAGRSADPAHRLPEPEGQLGRGTGVIVTVVGRNRPGILAEITAAIGEAEATVVDISQRTVDAFFHLVLTVELVGGADFAGLKQRLDCLGGKDDYSVRIMHEGVFRFMHRV